MKKILISSFIVMISLFFYGCTKDKLFDEGDNVIYTKEISEINFYSAKCRVQVESDLQIKSMGVCWSTEHNPTIYDNNQSINEFKYLHDFTIKNLKDGTRYYVRAYATNDCGTIYGEELTFKTKPVSGTLNGHKWVDMGLPSGLKWATCNVGASSPEDYGNYYQWGMTYTQSYYNNETCTTYKKDIKEFSGNPTYDVARNKWSSTWRVPKYWEMRELRNECTWVWTTVNGIKGYRVTGPNGNSIFFPAAGCIWGSSVSGKGVQLKYWSSTPNGDENHYFGADMDLNTEYEDWERDWSRSYGQSVRPVTD